MERTPDLVRDSLLETRFHTRYVSHRHHDSESTSAERSVLRHEYWSREKYLGGGSYGTVWLEKCIKGHRDHTLRAVKEIPRGHHSHKKINYNRGLEAIAKFSQQKYVRCFVKSFGWYEHTDAIFIAMEYCAEGDLHRYLSANPVLTEAEAQQIAHQLVEGLAFMHENDFAHRDLKPGNILVKSKLPGCWWVKISDFGISKRVGDGMAFSSAVKGTIGYMAPELHGFVDLEDCFSADDAHRASCAADIWSLGEIVFQTLTKEASFQNMGVLSAFVKQAVSFPSSALQRFNVSETGVDFIHRLMLPEPKHRMGASEALYHHWIRSWTAPNRRPSSLISTGPSELDVDVARPEPWLSHEPSGKWSTVTMGRRSSDELASTNIMSSVETVVGDSDGRRIDHNGTNHTKKEADDTSTAQHGNPTVPVHLSSLYNDSAPSGSPNISNPELLQTAEDNTNKLIGLELEAAEEIELRKSGQTDKSIDLDSDWLPTEHQPSSNKQNLSGQYQSSYLPRYLRHFGVIAVGPYDKESSIASSQRESNDTPPESSSTSSAQKASTRRSSARNPAMTRLPVKLVEPRNVEIEILLSDVPAPETFAHHKSTKESTDIKFYYLVINMVVSSDGSGTVIDSHRHPVGYVVEGDTERLKSCWVTQDGTVMNRRGAVEGFAYLYGRTQRRQPSHNIVSSSIRDTRTALIDEQGNLVLNVPKTKDILDTIPDLASQDEFMYSRYAALTCSPDQLRKGSYKLRPHLFAEPRDIKLAISIQVDSSGRALAHILRNVFSAIMHLYGYYDTYRPPLGIEWKSVVVVVFVNQWTDEFAAVCGKLGLDTQIFDQREIALQQEGTDNAAHHDNRHKRPLRIHGKVVQAQLYEYTTLKTLRSRHECFDGVALRLPVQLILCRANIHDGLKKWRKAIVNMLDLNVTISMETGMCRIADIETRD